MREREKRQVGHILRGGKKNVLFPSEKELLTSKRVSGGGVVSSGRECRDNITAGSKGRPKRGEEKARFL